MTLKLPKRSIWVIFGCLNFGHSSLTQKDFAFKFSAITHLLHLEMMVYSTIRYKDVDFYHPSEHQIDFSPAYCPTSSRNKTSVSHGLSNCVFASLHDDMSVGPSLNRNDEPESAKMNVAVPFCRVQATL